MTNKEKFPENTSPPYGIFYESMTVTVGKIEKGCRRVDQRHLNGYDMIPIIVTILHAKEKNDILPNVVSDDLNHQMINYICRYIYAINAQSKHSTSSSQNELARSDRRISQRMHRQIPSDTCIRILDDIVQCLLHVSRGQNRQHVNKGFGMFQLDTRPHQKCKTR
jgi:hypothetical protein